MAVGSARGVQATLARRLNERGAAKAYESSLRICLVRQGRMSLPLRRQEAYDF